MHSGYAVDSKQMWTMGNYSRFIRPGAKRVDVEVTDTAGIVIPDGDTQPYGVMLSAYINKDGKRVVVALNYSERTHPLSLTIDGVESAWRLYRTSDRSHENLSPVGTVQGKAILPPRSATTFVEK
jgi:O-glycosyl hydrolase